MFKFEVKLTEEDFLEFNKIHLFYSEQTGKQVKNLRSIFTVLPVVLWPVTTVLADFSLRELIARGLVYLPLAALFWFGVKPSMWLFTKQTLKKTLKKGDRLFSPAATLEFNDDVMVETTDINRSESKYSLIQSVYLVNGKIFYLYINSMQAFLLPVSAFASAEQYNNFLDFIQSKTKPLIIINEKR